MPVYKAALFDKLLRGAGAALAVKICSAASLYGVQVFLARWMGTAEYGIYDYATAVSVVGAFVAGFGFPTLALRFVSAYQAQEDWPRLGGIIGGSWWQTLLISTVIAGGGTVIWFRVTAVQGLGAYAVPLVFSLWTIPVLALVNLQLEVIRGFQQIILAFAPSLIVQPLLLVGMAAVWRSQRPLDSTVTLALSLGALLIVLALQWGLFQQTLDRRVRQARPRYEIVKWWRMAPPLVLLGGAHMVLSQTDTLMIGAFLNAEQVGIYGAAVKTSSWVPFILMSVNAVAAPLIATLYAQGDRQGLQQLVSAIARWMFYPTLAISLGLIVFSEPILRLFGAEFVAAKWALVALILGQLVNVGAGSVGYLMTMTGHQNQSALVMAASALVNVILNVIGLQVMGIVGAAIATALSMALWNVWLYGLVTRRLGVRPSIVDALRGRE